jgi:inactivated superfamily I helicase
VITPRQTRLVRAPHLRAFQRAIVEIVASAAPAQRRATVVLVSTSAAAGELRRTLENAWLASTPADAPASVLILPDILTRGEWYQRLHERLPGAPPLATDLEREVLFDRAGRAAIGAGCEPPFRLHPGLANAMLGLYDELRRRQQSIDAFERLMVGSLTPSVEIDRGAARMLAQTRFLVAAYREYERLLDEVDLLDEHRARVRLCSGAPAPALRHVVVTVADEVSDRQGLWPADFDLIARMPGLERVDIVATEETLTAGFHERLHHLLPGITDTRRPDDGDHPPVLVAPPLETNRLFWLSRDREEELVDMARRAKAVARAQGGAALDRVAVVYQRPLPYMYLARQVFGAAGVPCQSVDAVPLAAEPYAAAVDLVFTAVIAGFTRAALVALLRSPQFAFEVDGRVTTLHEIAALDAALQEARFLGGRQRLIDLATSLESGAAAVPGRSTQAASRAARAAIDAATHLAALEEPGAPSAQMATLDAFLSRFERLPEPDAPWRERHLRARAAVVGALRALGGAHARYDDAPRPFQGMAATVRRWIEAQTFSPRAGETGVHLVDAAAARYGDFDEVRLVGLVDTDWPEAIPRTIFYPAGLLAQLGWPPELERRSGPRSTFHDLIRLPARLVSLSTFTLEDDALARPSPFLEDLGEIGLDITHEPAGARLRIFPHEALMDEPLTPAAVGGDASAWLALRLGRTPADAPAFRGATDPRKPDVYRVSQVERYLECPFKYFAANVLGLAEERDDEPALTPQERGILLHEVLRDFFVAWQRSGHGAITADNFQEAVGEFARIAEARLAHLPEGDRALERARLLGSPVATGMAERAFGFEIGVETSVVERLLEHALDGEFALRSGDVVHRVRLRGKADRIDLLSDGTLRVIDYKLGAPQRLAIQLPVYGVTAEQRLAGYRGRAWRFASAAYVAFGDRRPSTFLAPAGTPFEAAVAEGQQRFLDAVDGIERGAFPVRPAEPFRCAFCAYPSVCRKDYVGDE